MKKLTKLTAFFLMTALILSMTACGSKEMPEAADEIIGVSMEKMDNAKELDMDMKMDLDMSMSGESISTKMDYKMLLFMDPFKAKIDMDIDLGASGSQKSTLYLGKEEDKYYMYMNLDNVWSKQALMDDNLDSILSNYGSQDVSIYLDNKDKFTILETIEEDGKTYTVLEGVLPKESVEEILSQTGLSEQLSMDMSILEDITLEEDFVIKVWVENDTVSVKKIIMDMTSFMNSVMSASMGVITGEMTVEELEANGINPSDLEVNVEKCYMEMTYNKTKDVEKFEIPQEALDAKDTGAADGADSTDGTEASE